MLLVTARRARGFSIIEFMIAITLSLLVMAAMSAAFVANSRARTEIDRANQQVESGRYALQLLSDDLEQAGYWSHLNLTNVPDSAVPDGLPPPGNAGNPWTGKPDACSTTLSGPSSPGVQGLYWAIKLHVQGYDNPSVKPLSCLPSTYKTGTDVIVIRRVATCISGPTAMAQANCAAVANAPYFQAALCADQLNSTNPQNYFRLDTNTANLDRMTRDCSSLAAMRQFMTNIYFIDSQDQPGDGIPTLKRLELTGGASGMTWTTVPLAHGIQNLQIEYGIDNLNSDGVPDGFTANPDTYNGATSCDANCIANWRNVMAVKLHVLATNTETTRDFLDTKIYTLGLNASGGTQCAKDTGPNTACLAFNNGYKKHVYETSVRLNNPAGRRES